MNNLGKRLFATVTRKAGKTAAAAIDLAARAGVKSAQRRVRKAMVADFNKRTQALGRAIVEARLKSGRWEIAKVFDRHGKFQRLVMRHMNPRKRLVKRLATEAGVNHASGRQRRKFRKRLQRATPFHRGTVAMTEAA